MKITDRKRWERQLADHMRRHAADLHNPPPEPPPRGMWVSARQVYLWTILVIIITSVGWVVGLYVI